VPGMVLETVKVKEEVLTRAYELGLLYEKSYHGCAQCTVAAIQDALEIRDDDLFRAANGLAGGLGSSSKGTCGSLAGGVMIISSLCGRSRDQFDDPGRIRERAYRLARRLLERFEAEFGSGMCGEIQRRLMGRSFDLLDPQDKEIFMKAGGERIHCPDVVGKGGRWAVEIILDEGLVGGK